MRVLIVHPHLSIFGGAETVVKRLSDCLASRGVENSIVTLTLTDDVKVRCNGMQFILPERGVYRYKVRSTNLFSAFGLLREIKGLRDILKKKAREFDVVNVHNFPSTWATWGIGRPVVWMCNEPPALWNNSAPSLLLRSLYAAGSGVDRFLVRRLAGAICVSDEFNRRRIEERYGLEAVVIPYGIECDLFKGGDREGTRARYGLGGRFVVLQVGMITPQKNQMASLRALDSLGRNFRDVTLVLAGADAGDYAGKVKAFVGERGLMERVVFTGHVSKEEVRDLYAACDLALFPVKSQGGWLAPFEAMVSGRPLIVSREMGAAGLIGANDLGIVTDDYVEAIKDVYLEYEGYAEKAKRSGKWVETNLGWDRFTERMIEVFRNTLKRRRLI